MTKLICPPLREPNGRRQRPRKTQQDALNEANARDRLAIIGVVIHQPHRVAFDCPDSPLLGCATGRFVVRQHMAREIVPAVETYAEAKRKWYAAKGIPTDVNIGGNGGDFEEEVVKKLFNAFKAIETSVATVAGMNALSLIQGAAFWDMDIPDNSLLPSVKLGLVELAYVTGHLARPRHGG